jgi:hypothetical protein
LRKKRLPHAPRAQLRILIRPQGTDRGVTFSRS